MAELIAVASQALGARDVMVATDQDKLFGVLLRHHRLKAALTQLALAEKAGLSARTIQNLEGGHEKPYPDTTFRLIGALELSGEPRSNFEGASSPRPRKRSSAEASYARGVFLYHGGHDTATVEGLARELRTAGLAAALGNGHLPLSAGTRDEVLAGLRSANACAIFVGTNGIGDWDAEQFALIREHAQRDPSFALFAVLLPGVADPFDATTLPAPLDVHPWVDLRSGADRPHALRLLVAMVQGNPVGREWPAAPIAGACPYRGLQPFEEEHAELFFGRDGDIQRLLEKLKSTRFLAVVAPSGSGKSSLVRAGLLPALLGGALPWSNTWIQRVFMPGAQPLSTLAANLLDVSHDGAMQQTLDYLQEDPRTLHLGVSLALARHPPSTRVVWVVDQFEEVFTQCRDERARAAFVANLLYAAAIPEGQSIVVLTLRADFYPRCASYPELAARIAAQQYLVTPMDGVGFRQAIERPARRTGLIFEPGLVSTILHDVSGAPGALPLLEHALLELWEQRRGNLLTLDGYCSSGRVQGAIAERAEAVYDSLGVDDQIIARRILHRLTEPGEAGDDTRRRVALDALVTHSCERDATERVVRALADARLLTTSGDEQSGQTWVQVAHEALIRGWPRLRHWLDDDRAWLRILRRLSEDAHDWQQANLDEGLLYRGARLSEALEWPTRSEEELNLLERDFLNASIALKVREEQAVMERQQRDLEASRRLAVIEKERTRSAQALVTAEKTGTCQPW